MFRGLYSSTDYTEHIYPSDPMNNPGDGFLCDETGIKSFWRPDYQADNGSRLLLLDNPILESNLERKIKLHYNCN